MPTHMAWNSIELLHNVVRTLNFLNERDGDPLPSIRYRGKVKLHGTNCAVQVTPEGVFAQSRTQMLVDGEDYKGFARWVESHRDYFASLAPCAVFGEWCGPGVEKGMAISQVKEKQFVVFAVVVDGAVLYEPEDINGVLHGTHVWIPKTLHVLPWLPFTLTLDYGDEGSMERVSGIINRVVREIEQEDPWVKATFGISGIGEGVVFYPVDESATADPERLAMLMFKAKGDKHRTAGQKPAQVKPDVASGVPEFVALVVTDARLEQGVSEACGGELDMRHTGAFLRWVMADVEKESVAELEAAGLEWGQVQKAVQDATREWWKGHVLGR